MLVSPRQMRSGTACRLAVGFLQGAVLTFDRAARPRLERHLSGDFGVIGDPD
jgi:hypothetical protein